MKVLNSNFKLNWEHVETLYNLEITNRRYLIIKEGAKVEHNDRLHNVKIMNLI